MEANGAPARVDRALAQRESRQIALGDSEHPRDASTKGWSVIRLAESDVEGDFGRETGHNEDLIRRRQRVYPERSGIDGGPCKLHEPRVVGEKEHLRRS